MADVTDAIRPTLLMVGRGEAMDAALKVALDRHGLQVLDAEGDPKTAVKTVAPDVVLLVGDAAADGGRVILDVLATDAVTNVVPVIVLGPAEKLDGRITAFRAGAVAVVPRTASADQIATRVAAVAREIAERGEARPDELGEATFDELVTMVASELRSGILSVGRQRQGGAEPMRIVLGAGRPVADAVEEFVRKLRPLVSRAEPLTYELHASAGGPVGLLEPEPAGRGDLSVLLGLRIILVDSDASRADTLAQELRSRGSMVAVADPSARGIERARGLDPHVVIVDAAGMDGTGFEVVRAIRRDVRLRWAAMLVAPWAEIWPESAATPDIAELALRLAPLVTHDRELRARATNQAKFDARLEVTGPSRLLRVLASLTGPFHVLVQSRKASVEIDIAEGLVVGAKATRAAGDVLEGTRALAALLAMASARVTIEKRPNPSTANVMAPVEEALARASQEAAPIPVSQPPPPLSSGPPIGRGKRSPFPTASEVGGRGIFEDDGDASGPVRPPIGVRSRVSAPSGDATSRDLKWTESEHGAGPAPAPPAARAPEAPTPSAAVEVPKGVFSAARSTGTKMPVAAPKVQQRAGASAFGERGLFPNVTPATPTQREDATRRVHGETLARAASDVPPGTARVPPPSSLSSSALPTAKVGPPGRAPERKPSSPGFRPPSSPAFPAVGVLPPAHPSTAGDVAAPATKARSSAPPPAASASAFASSAPTPASTTSPGSATSTTPGSDRAAPYASRPGGRKATLVMGALQGAASRPAPPASPPVPVPGSTVAPRSPTLTMGTPESGAPRPAPPVGAEKLETVSASFDSEPGSDPLFADGKKAMESGEHGSEPPPSDEGASVSLRSAEHTSPSVRPFVPEGDAMKEPVGAPPVPDSALIAPPSRPRPRADPLAKTVPAATATGSRVVPPPSIAEGEIGSFAMSQAPAPPAIAVTPRTDPTPLGVISMPAPPSGVASSRPPPVAATAPAASGGAGRSAAWVLVALGVLAVLGVGGWAAYVRRAQLMSLAGMTPPEVTAIALDAGAALAESPDAGGATLAVVADVADAGAALAEDTGPSADDAWVDPNDAWVDPNDAFVAVAVEAPDAWTAPPPSGEASVTELLAQAAHADAATAESLYRRVLELDPNEHHAAHELGDILMRRHDAAAAVPMYELVTRRRPGQAGNWIDLGDARRDAGDTAGARAAWRTALEHDPDNATAHERLGE